jgi:hypothetical protein
MLVDRFLSDYDVTKSWHVLVAADVETTWSALRALDLTKIRAPVVRATLALARALQNRARSRFEGRAPLPDPDRLTLDDLEAFGRVILGEEPASEIVIGAVERRSETLPIAASEFAAFDRPGCWKGVGCFSMRPYGARRTLLSYEARVRATDAASRRRLFRYLELVEPLAARVAPAMLEHVRVVAEGR